MLEFRKRKKVKRMIYSPIILAVLAIFFVLLCRGVWKVYQKTDLSFNNLEKSKNELNKLVDRQSNLSSALDYLKTDKGIEDEIRSKFRLVKGDEKVAVIIDEKPTAVIPLVSTTTKKSFWSSIFNWF